MPAAGNIVDASPGSCSVSRSSTGGTGTSPPGYTVARGTGDMGSTVVSEMVVVAAEKVVVAKEIVVVPVEIATIVQKVVVFQEMIVATDIDHWG